MYYIISLLQFSTAFSLRFYRKCAIILYVIIRKKVIKRIGKNMDINKTIAEEFKLRQEQIDNTVALLDDDKTIPFIARYRKELTGSLDDQVLREIADRLTYLRNLEKRTDLSSRSVKQGLRWQEKRGLNHWLNLS